VKRLLALLLFIPLAWGWTGVVGSCAQGDVNGTFDYVVAESAGHDVVHIVLCGETTLPSNEVIRAYEVNISGGILTSSVPVYVRIYATKVYLENIRTKNVYFIISAEETDIKDVNIDVPDEYCLKIIADSADINSVLAENCETGIVVEANRITLASFVIHNVKNATDIHATTLNIFPVKEVSIVETVKEINTCKPCEKTECDITPYVNEIMILRRENTSLIQQLSSCEKNVSSCTLDLEALKRVARSGGIDISWIVALAACALGFGYLLGRA